MYIYYIITGTINQNSIYLSIHPLLVVEAVHLSTAYVHIFCMVYLYLLDISVKHAHLDVGTSDEFCTSLILVKSNQ